VDGDTGEVVVWPSPKTLAQYPNLSRGESRDLKPVDPVPGIKVYANLNLAKQAGESAEIGRRGSVSTGLNLNFLPPVSC
jgi:hypothetical protein